MNAWGQTRAGNQAFELDADTKRVARFAVGAASYVVKLTAHMDGGGKGEGPQVVRPVIYSSAGVLVAVGPEVRIADEGGYEVANLVLNPSAEVDLTSITHAAPTDSTGRYISHITTDGYVGTACAEAGLTAMGSGNHVSVLWGGVAPIATHASPVFPGQIVSLRAAGKPVTGTGSSLTLAAQFYDAAGANLGSFTVGGAGSQGTVTVVNRLSNPRAEVDLTGVAAGWDGSAPPVGSTGGLLSRVTTDFYVGVACFQVGVSSIGTGSRHISVINGGVAPLATYALPVTPGQIWSLRSAAKAVAGNPTNVKLVGRFWDWEGFGATTPAVDVGGVGSKGIVTFVNRIENPAAETDISGIGRTTPSQGTGAATTRIATDGFLGEATCVEASVTTAIVNSWIGVINSASPLTDGVSVSAGQIVSLRAAGKAVAGASPDGLRLSARFYDSTGTFLQDVAAGGVGAQGTITNPTLGTWYELWGTATAPTNAAFVAVRIVVDSWDEGVFIAMRATAMQASIVASTTDFPAYEKENKDWFELWGTLTVPGIGNKLVNTNFEANIDGTTTFWDGTAINVTRTHITNDGGVGTACVEVATDAIGGNYIAVRDGPGSGALGAWPAYGAPVIAGGVYGIRVKAKARCGNGNKIQTYVAVYDASLTRIATIAPTGGFRTVVNRVSNPSAKFDTTGVTSGYDVSAPPVGVTGGYFNRVTNDYYVGAASFEVGGTIGSNYERLVRTHASLKAYFRMDEASGTTAVNDGGTSPDGTYRNAPASVAALVADGAAARQFVPASSQDISVPDHNDLDLATNFSVEFWMKRATADATIDNNIHWKGTGALNIVIDSGNEKVTVVKRGTGIIVAASVATTDTNVHHVVVTKDATNTGVKIYIDGVDRTGTVTDRGALSATTDTLVIGSNGAGAGYFDGALDNYAIYHSVLTPTEVDEHYRTGVTAPSTHISVINGAATPLANAVPVAAGQIVSLRSVARAVRGHPLHLKIRAGFYDSTGAFLAYYDVGGTGSKGVHNVVNRVDNPSAEIDLTGVAVTGPGGLGTLTRVTTDGALGETTCFDVDHTTTQAAAWLGIINGGSSPLSNAVPVAEGEIVSLRSAMKLVDGPTGASTKLNLTARFYDAAGAFLSDSAAGGTGHQGSVTDPALGTWYELFGTVTAPANAAFVAVRAYADSFASGVHVQARFTAMQATIVSSTTDFPAYEKRDWKEVWGTVTAPANAAYVAVRVDQNVNAHGQLAVLRTDAMQATIVSAATDFPAYEDRDWWDVAGTVTIPANGVWATLDTAWEGNSSGARAALRVDANAIVKLNSVSDPVPAYQTDPTHMAVRVDQNGNTQGKAATLRTDAMQATLVASTTDFPAYEDRGWRELWGTYTVPDDAAYAGGRVNWNGNAGGQAAVVRADAMQIVAVDSATSFPVYVDGGAPGHVWLGAAHASPTARSSRVVNLVSNPSFEVDTTGGAIGVATGSTGTSIFRDTARSYVGTASGGASVTSIAAGADHVSYINGGGSPLVNAAPVSPGQIIAVRAAALKREGTGTTLSLQVQYYDSRGVSLGAWTVGGTGSRPSVTNVVTEAWYELWGTHTVPDSAARAAVRTNLTGNTIGGSAAVRTDANFIVGVGSATDFPLYVDGDMDGYAFLGAAHNSQTIKTAARWVDLRFDTPGGVYLDPAGDYDFGVLGGPAARTIRVHGRSGGTGQTNADTYSDGPAATFGAATALTTDLSLFATYTRRWTVTATADDFYYARLPHNESQDKFLESAPDPTTVLQLNLDWHGTLLDPDRGAFCLVSLGDPHGLLGERVRITYTGATGLDRSVVCYVHGTAPLLADISVPRALFRRLGNLAATSLSVTVEKMASV